MPAELLVPILIFVFLLVVVGVLIFRYDKEIRGLFPRLQRFRADRKGFESTFTPAQEEHPVGLGPGAAPETEVEDPSEFAVSESDAVDIDLEVETDPKKLHNEMLAAAVGDDFERAEKGIERLRSLEPDPVSLAESEAVLDAIKFFKRGDPKDFDSLRARVEDPAIAAYAESLTGMVLRNLKRPAEAAEAYKRGVEAAKKPKQRAELLASWAEIASEIGQARGAVDSLKAELAVGHDPSVQATLWKALAESYESQGKYFEQAMALQEVRGQDPTNSDLCFSIGWALSQSGRSDIRPLAIHFYWLACYLDPNDQFALNNLGWEYEKSGMSIEAAKHYKKAAELGNTLAMANLAGIKLRAGLADEAGELLNEAGEEDDAHESVVSLSADVARLVSEQRDKARSLDQNGRALAEFCVDLTRAESESRPDRLANRWQWDEGGEARLEIIGEAVECLWNEGGTKRRLLAQLVGRAGTGSLYKMGVRYSFVDGEEKETGWEETGSLLLILEEDGQGIKLAVLNEGGATFRLLSVAH